MCRTWNPHRARICNPARDRNMLMKGREMIMIVKVCKSPFFFGVYCSHNALQGVDCCEMLRDVKGVILSEGFSHITFFFFFFFLAL